MTLRHNASWQSLSLCRKSFYHGPTRLSANWDDYQNANLRNDRLNIRHRFTLASTLICPNLVTPLRPMRPALQTHLHQARYDRVEHYLNGEILPYAAREKHKGHAGASPRSATFPSNRTSRTPQLQQSSSNTDEQKLTFNGPNE